MSVSLYSFVMSITWSSLFICLFYLCRKQDMFIKKFGLPSLFLLLVVAIIRMLCAFEMPFSIVISSSYIYPAVNDFLYTKIFYGLSMLHVLVALWILISCVLLFRIIRQYRKYVKSVQLIPIINDPQATAIMENIIGGGSSKAFPNIVKSVQIKIPFIIGFKSPTIYIPNICFTDDELYYVLLHEWTHFIHRDGWIKLITQIICAIYWWNPLVYLLSHDLEQTLEINCDKAVANKLSAQELADYARVILKVFVSIDEKPSSDPILSSALIQSGSSNRIIQRFRLVLDNKQKKPKKGSVLFLMIFALFSFAFSFLFVMQPDYGAPPEFFSEGLYGSENAYIVPNETGGYDLYVDETFHSTLTQDEITSLLKGDIPIKNK